MPLVSVRRSASLLLAAGLVATACSDSQSGQQPVLDTTTTSIEVISTDDPVAATTDANPTTTSTTSTTSTTLTPPSTSSTTIPDPEAGNESAAAVWERAWQVAAADGATVEDLADIATPDVAERLVFTLNPEGDDALRTVVNSPVVADDGVSINDCLLITPPVAGPSSKWYTGSFEPNGASWTITALEPVDIGGCVPAALAEAVLVDYADGIAALDDYWSPADPDHPRLAETTTGEQYDFLVDLIGQDRDAGLEYQEEVVSSPEIVEYRSPSEIVVRDCQSVLELGLFDTVTGERQADPPEAPAGQMALLSIVMVQDDGRWKDSDNQGGPVDSCEVGPTIVALPQV